MNAFYPSSELSAIACYCLRRLDHQGYPIAALCPFPLFCRSGIRLIQPAGRLETFLLRLFLLDIDTCLVA